MISIVKAIAFGVGCFLGGNEHFYGVTGFVVRKGTTTKKTRWMPSDAHFFQRVSEWRMSSSTDSEESTGDESSDTNPNPTAGAGNDESKEIPDVVSTTTTPLVPGTSNEPAPIEEEINPVFAAVTILAGLAFSFLLLYYELQQAQFLND